MTQDLVRDIESSRRGFLDLLDSFDNAVAHKPIDEGRWSPLEYLEHLVRAEEATVWRMFKAVEDARAGHEILVSSTPDASIEEIVERTWAGAVDAPPLAIPALGGSKVYWMIRMSRNAALVAALADFVDVQELDRVAYPHPISGPFTMRQGFQFIRFHLDRHALHIRDVQRTTDGGHDAPGAR